MHRIQKFDANNRLLNLLGDDDYALLQPFIARVPLTAGQIYAEAGAPIRVLCFPEGAVAAVLESVGSEWRRALGIVGLEGFIGWPALLGRAHWPHEVVIRGGSATALQIDLSRIEDACRQSAQLHALLLRFVGTFIAQMSATLVANAVEPLEQRLARWLLLCHDRLEGDEISLTHQEIAMMLGVRRASATDALHLLESARAIRNTRGRVAVRDRAELQRIAGESYGRAEREYRQLIGPFGKAAWPEQQPRPVAAVAAE